jgi:hypothetical protein
MKRELVNQVRELLELNVGSIPARRTSKYNSASMGELVDPARLKIRRYMRTGSTPVTRTKGTSMSEEWFIWQNKKQVRAWCFFLARLFNS